MKLHPALASALALVLLPSAALAQSRFTQAIVGATNGVNDLPPIAYETGTGESVSVDSVTSFTGFDRAFEERTMTYSGSAFASAEFGRLRARVSGSLENTYYNEENVPFYTGGEEVNYAGSPEQFGVLGFAGFTDGLQFGGTLSSGYRARYVFFVHGRRSGPSVVSSLYCTIGNNPTESFTAIDRDGENGEYFTTQSYLLDGGFQQDVEVLFTAQFNPNTITVADGSTVVGSGDYSSTATLSAILLFDANDQPVANYTVTGSSNTVYPTSAVPEPATLAALATGGIALLARRRRRG